MKLRGRSHRNLRWMDRLQIEQLRYQLICGRLSPVAQNHAQTGTVWHRQGAPPSRHLLARLEHHCQLGERLKEKVLKGA